MRVIGGTAKSISLVSLKGARVRPTLDRVRESLFNQLAGEIADSRFLELVSGMGLYGLLPPPKG